MLASQTVSSQASPEEDMINKLNDFLFNAVIRLLPGKWHSIFLGVMASSLDEISLLYL